MAQVGAVARGAGAPVRLNSQSCGKCKCLNGSGYTTGKGKRESGRLISYDRRFVGRTMSATAVKFDGSRLSGVVDNAKL